MVNCIRSFSPPHTEPLGGISSTSFTESSSTQSLDILERGYPAGRLNPKFEMPPSNASPSPPPSTCSEVLQHGLHHILQHNANKPYPQEQYLHNEAAGHLQPYYGSPTPGPDEGYGYHGQQQPNFMYHQNQDPRPIMQYEGYNSEYHGSGYQDQYSTPATSPPTPSMNNDGMTTRSGYNIPRAHQNPRPKPEPRSYINKTPKAKKAKKEKVKPEKRMAKLERPLSELTKHWTHVPVADIEAYVNRSVEERRREVEDGKCPGKVKRPMNSFMLYRKAYQNRTKDWCLQNNHQVVSQVCGDSWPLEPESVKEQFSEWARIERQNHQNAHPGYKFSPAKPGAAKATAKRKISQDQMSEESELEDFEWQAAQPRRSKKPRSTPIQDQSVQYPSTRSAYQYPSRESSVDPNYGGYNMSSYQATNPGKPTPVQYSQANLDVGQYYQQSVQSNHKFARVEDVIMRKAAIPGGRSYLGLPGGPDFDMVNPYPQYEGNIKPELRIDPSLMAQDQALYGNGLYNGHSHDGLYLGGGVDSPGGDQNWQQPYGMDDQESLNHQDPVLNYLDPVLTMTNVHMNDQNVQGLKDNQENWHVESLEANQEFEKWMNEE